LKASSLALSKLSTFAPHVKREPYYGFIEIACAQDFLPLTTIITIKKMMQLATDSPWIESIYWHNILWLTL
jgi:hypothetical protein